MLVSMFNTHIILFNGYNFISNVSVFDIGLTETGNIDIFMLTVFSYFVLFVWLVDMFFLEN